MTEPSFIGDLHAFEALDDMDVVQRIIDGDRPLFELIMRRYNRRLFRIARSVLKDATLAEDAVQDAYIHAYQHLHQFRGPTGFSAWLIRITIREASRVRRREAKLTPATESDPDELPASDNPERASIDLEAAHLLEEALDKLPEEFRLVFVMRELEELSVSDVANVLDLKPATVKTRLFRARALLKLKLRSRLRPATDNALPFGGDHCDAIVAHVLHAIAALEAR